MDVLAYQFAIVECTNFKVHKQALNQKLSFQQKEQL